MKVAPPKAPPEFLLDNYKVFENLRLSEWAAEVDRRLPLALNMERGSFPTERTFRGELRSLAVELMSKPRRSISREHITSDEDCTADVEPSTLAGSRDLQTMRSMTLTDARGIARSVSHRGLEVEFSKENIVAGFGEYFDDLALGSQRDPTWIPTQWLGIDIEQPTEALKRDFIRWVSATKRARSVKAVGDGLSVNHWVVDGLLPYFDLTAHAWTEGQRYSDADIFAVLFPDDESTEDGARRVKQTIRPNAKRLVTRRMYRRLCAKADWNDEHGGS